MCCEVGKNLRDAGYLSVQAGACMPARNAALRSNVKTRARRVTTAGPPMAKVLEKPELLAPAGDEESLRAAVAAGADAVYFGLRGGFNARARADNFAAEDLPRVFDFLHSKGVQG